MFQINVIFLKHTLELAYIEAVFTVTMFLKCQCEPVARTHRVTPLGVMGLRL